MFYSSENEILQWPFAKLAQLWETAVLLQVQKAPQCPIATGPFSPTGLTCASKVYLEQESPNPCDPHTCTHRTRRWTQALKSYSYAKKTQAPAPLQTSCTGLTARGGARVKKGRNHRPHFSHAVWHASAVAVIPKHASQPNDFVKVSFAATSCEYISSLLQVASNRLWLFGSTTSKIQVYLAQSGSNAKRRSL